MTKSSDESPVTCPVCRSTQIQGVKAGSGQGFDAAGGVIAGLLGTICLGPVGVICLLCGITDKKDDKFVRMCLNCGHQF
jgi:hypothetical protein